MIIDELKKLYRGFYIEQPVGNNEFSFDKRRNRSIWVAPLVDGLPGDIREGNNIAFAEVEDDREISAKGLEQFLYFEHADRPVFIFDNHNHAFTFWAWGIEKKRITAQAKLIHVDQHSDMRRPDDEPPLCLSLAQAFDYANFNLNVGNFIKPALQLGWFSDTEIINTEEGFRQEFAEPFVLDIDLDVFAPELDYVDNDLKIQRIRYWMQEAQLTTIAFSPYFIRFDLAREYIIKICK